jgi:hypothetical protein
MKIGTVSVLISHCTVGVYLRWWFNGWHYFNFTNGYEITMQSESMDTQVTKMFSVISKIEHPTKLKADYAYRIILEGITAANIAGFTGLLLAEKVEQYEIGTHGLWKWREVEITRGAHVVREEYTPGYILSFEITRKELPDKPAVFQKSVKLYHNVVLCDMDVDEVVPVNKQTNDIAEMQDRQSDFTATFKIRKTRAMRALFELSGEVGADTTFPYENQPCRLVQDNIEMITNGILILDTVDDSYYYVSIYSGNLNFFKVIGSSKLTDLETTSPDSLSHTWDITTQKLTHDASPEMDFVYPLLEPSDDAAMNPTRLSGNITELYGGWIWPFVKVKTLWDEIFVNAGFICDTASEILTNDIFNNLYIPIQGLKLTKAYTDKFLYSLQWFGSQTFGDHTILPGGTLIHGDALFATGHYRAPFDAKYKIVVHTTFPTSYPAIFLYKNGVQESVFTITFDDATTSIHEGTTTAVSGDDITVYTSGNTFYFYSIAIIEINDAKISYGSIVNARGHLPDMTQLEFIKMICNMFGLIPEVTPRDYSIRFWNFVELYDHMPEARDWSAYLSEREDETEFKFGDYAQKNHLMYKACQDVLVDNGKGTMSIDDETLQLEKDVLTLNIATCDEIEIAYTTPINVSRIAMNQWYNDSGTYRPFDSIDPRIVYVKHVAGKELILWDDALMVGNHVHIADPRAAVSVDIAFSSLIVNYAGLSRMLTRTNLRRAKFNLPVYEVAGLRHYIPIYLSQYKAYFYVNKINNYVPGKLCTIDLIKL